MDYKKTVCTACSCLCDDINLQLEDDIIRRVENACLKGSSLMYATQFDNKRGGNLIEGREATYEQAVERAAAELSGAKRPFIFGLDNSGIEAQAVGIELAKALRGSIDDTSSFCQGAIVEQLLKGALPTCTFADLPKSDLIIYWGANPHHSHPRHLAKFTIYAHPEYLELGAVRKVTMVAIEVRQSETAVVCHRVVKIPPKGDREYIQAVIKGIKGEQTTPDAQRLVDLLRKSSFCVIFAGLGLTYSLNNDFSTFTELAGLLSKWSRVAVIPMAGHFNMRGFNHTLHKATGYVNKVSFADGVSHGGEYSLLEQVKAGKPDCLMVVGSDPFASLPKSVVAGLGGIPIISVDPFKSATTAASTVVVSGAATGMEVGGTAVRMDGSEITLNPARKSSRPGDEEILKGLLERVGR